MLREYNYVLRKVNMGVDLCLSVLAFFIAHWTRGFLAMYVLPGQIEPAGIADYAWALFFLPALTVLVLAYNGFYRSQRIRASMRSLIRLIALSCLEITALLMVVIYFSGRAAQLSRPLIFLVPFMLLFLLSLKTYFMRRALMTIRTRGLNFRRVVLVGSGEPLRRFINYLEDHPIWGLKIEGIITDRPVDDFHPTPKPGDVMDGYPLIGNLETAIGVLEDTMVDEVVLIPNATAPAELTPIMAACEEIGVRTHLPLHYFEGQIAKPSIDYFDQIPVISYSPTREMGPALLFKYAFDRIVAAILLVVLSIPMLLVMLTIRLFSKRGEPIFYSQPRSGLNGREFKCFKFRSMVVGADEMREALSEHNELEGPVFKMKEDPRVTKIGRILRKTSIDELPQLWNVLKGEMSLVGPRPPLPAEVKLYDRWQRRRLSMKPGMTCLWQVMGRNELPFETWMRLDLQYIDSWSLMLDFKILARTVLVVITGHGAM